MVAICFYFQIHQPYRMKNYKVFDIGKSSDYFDDPKNKEVMEKVATKCYLPTTRLLLKLIKQHKGKFKCSFSITGTALEQFEKYSPEVINLFKEMVKTGCVEFLSETYYHSLSFLYSKDEFKSQIELHRQKIFDLFGCRPTIFRNTELIFNNELANFCQKMGYKGVIAEGADHILEWRSPNFLYTAVTAPDIKLLLKNYKLSDDIAFRFSDKGWKEFPLTAPKFVKWVDHINSNGDVVNLFMDYETFGEHQWEDKGIFEFLEHLPGELLKHPDNCFMTPSEVVDSFPTRGDLDIHNPVSWADVERDLSAWMGNNIQTESLRNIYNMEREIKTSNNTQLIEDWRKLTTSDHFYYMCTKWFNDGDVHKYFNPYDTPYDSFISFMNIVNDLKIRLKSGQQIQEEDPPIVADVKINT